MALTAVRPLITSGSPTTTVSRARARQKANNTLFTVGSTADGKRRTEDRAIYGRRAVLLKRNADTMSPTTTLGCSRPSLVKYIPRLTRTTKTANGPPTVRPRCTASFGFAGFACCRLTLSVSMPVNGWRQ